MGENTAPHDRSRRDREVFGELYRPLRRFASFVGPSWDDPDDLVQEALARSLAGGSLSRFDDPQQYLRRVILNLAINESRSRRFRTQRLGRLVTDAAPASDIYPSDLADLQVLGPVDRAVLFMADVEGRAFGEIAELLAKRESTLRGRAARARRRLRNHLSDLEEGR